MVYKIVKVLITLQFQILININYAQQ